MTIGTGKATVKLYNLSDVLDTTLELPYAESYPISPIQYQGTKFINMSGYTRELTDNQTRSGELNYNTNMLSQSELDAINRIWAKSKEGWRVYLKPRSDASLEYDNVIFDSVSEYPGTFDQGVTTVISWRVGSVVESNASNEFIP